MSVSLKPILCIVALVWAVPSFADCVAPREVAQIKATLAGAPERDTGSLETRQRYGISASGRIYFSNETAGASGYGVQTVDQIKGQIIVDGSILSGNLADTEMTATFTATGDQVTCMDPGQIDVSIVMAYLGFLNQVRSQY